MRFSERFNPHVCVERAGRRMLLIIWLTLALSAAAFAQAATTGTLSGVVQDPNGAVVTGVQVRITNTGTAL